MKILIDIIASAIAFVVIIGVLWLLLVVIHLW
jgi:hypothetical protein